MTERDPGPARAPRIVWHGQLVRRGGLLLRGAGLMAPGLLWLLVLLVIPSLVLAAVAFATRDAWGQVEWSFQLGNFRRLAGWGVLGWSPDTLRILWRSLWLAGLTTALALGLAYPLAFVLAQARGAWRAVWLSAVIVPMCTNLVVRTYAWELLLSRQLPPARLSAWLGLIEPDRALYPGLLAVILATVQNALPFAVLPLWTNVERLDWSLVEAARDLYAGRLTTLRRAILPQTLPGLVVAGILTFVPTAGMFVITDRLGGGKHDVLGNLIQRQFNVSRDYPYGSALSLVLILLTLAGLVLVRRKGKGVELV